MCIRDRHSIGGGNGGHSGEWISEATQLLEKGKNRSEEGGVGPQGHPWGVELEASINQLNHVKDDQSELANWIEGF